MTEELGMTSGITKEGPVKLSNRQRKELEIGLPSVAQAGQELRTVFLPQLPECFD